MTCPFLSRPLFVRVCSSRRSDALFVRVCVCVCVCVCACVCVCVCVAVWASGRTGEASTQISMPRRSPASLMCNSAPLSPCGRRSRCVPPPALACLCAPLLQLYSLSPAVSPALLLKGHSPTRVTRHASPTSVACAYLSCNGRPTISPATSSGRRPPSRPSTAA